MGTQKPLENLYRGTKVLKDLGTFGIKSYRKAIFECKYCGSNFETRVAYVKNGGTESCGCFGKQQRLKATQTHKDSQKKSKHNYIYSRYNNMIGRCYNSNDSSYHNYGGKGVVVCDEWKNSYPEYKKWCLENGITVDLFVDKDKICIEQNIYPPYYSPSTCSLLTKKENDLYRARKIGIHGYFNIYIDKRKNIRKYFGTINKNGIVIRTKMHLTAESASIELERLLSRDTGR